MKLSREVMTRAEQKLFLRLEEARAGAPVIATWEFVFIFLVSAIVTVVLYSCIDAMVSR